MRSNKPECKARKQPPGVKDAIRELRNPMSRGPIDSDAFRALMRHVPGQVNIIAAGQPGERIGLTATAVCSLSDAPPTVLVCVNRRVSAHDAIIENQSFSINALAAGQEDIAAAFSGAMSVRGEARFAHGAWSAGETGVPTLAGAVCTLECRLADFKAVSTHTILFGQIVAGSALSHVAPLVYLRGSYLSLGAANSPE